jgi:PEGA domain
LVRLVDDVKGQLAAAPRASLEIKSRPPGARVVVDGRRRGKAPMVLEDLSPGAHYVLMDSPDGRHTERVELDDEGARVLAKVGGKKRANAKEVLALVEKPVGAKQLVDIASEAGDDVVVAVLLPAGKNLDVICGRIADGEVKSVLGITAGPLENDRETAAFLLAEGIREQKKDRWLDTDSTRNAGELREQLFTGKGSTVIEEEGDGPSPALIAVGIIGGVGVATALGVGVALFAVREARKDEGFTWSVDGSRL